MIVGDLMTPSPVTVPPEQSSGAALELMREYDIRRLLVVGPNGRLLGILSNRDLGGAPPDQPVGERMTTHLVVIGPGATIGAAARRMLSHKVDGLPVVSVDEDGDPHLLGILTTTDLLRYLADLEGSPAAEA